MKLEDKYEIKRKLKNTVKTTLKQTGKKPTKSEIFNVLLDIAKSVMTEEPKDNWEKSKEPESIKEILKWS